MLRLSEVTAGYTKAHPVLKNISLEIKKEEIFILVGPNGSGKSTLLKTTLGLLSPQKGTITFDDKNIAVLSPTARAQKISLLESHVSIASLLTVEELLHLSKVRRLPNRQMPDRQNPSQVQSRMQEAIDALEIKKFLSHPLLELSSGEQKRALLAHALATPSEVIMLDEPFSHLDWHHQIRLVETLKTWQKQFHTTFVLAAHELGLAVQLAHRMAVLHQGRLVACDTPDTIFKNQNTCEVFAFQALIDENPMDGSRRLTLAKRQGTPTKPDR